MGDVKWVKITTDMFDNRKIKHLRRLPDGNNVVLIWVMLLTMAGRCNAGGTIFLTENIPYTPKMLADELDFEENTVLLALNALQELGMISSNGSSFCIANWQEYQNIEGMDKIREQNRLRKQRQRERLENEPQSPALPASRDSHVTVTPCHATDIEEDKEEDIDTITVSKDTVCRTDVQRIVHAWNDLGVSAVSKLSPNTKRYNNLRSRMRDYGTENVLKAIDNIRHSDFLMGRKGDGWRITFDWFVLPNNFPKVLDGNYSNKEGGASRGSNHEADYSQYEGGGFGTLL